MGHFSQLVRSPFWLAVLCHGGFYFFPACFCNIYFTAICTNKGIFAFSVTALALIAVTHTKQERIYSPRDLCSLQEKVASHGVHNSYSCFQKGMKWFYNRNISLTLIVCWLQNLSKQSLCLLYFCLLEKREKRERRGKRKIIIKKRQKKSSQPVW